MVVVDKLDRILDSLSEALVHKMRIVLSPAPHEKRSGFKHVSPFGQRNEAVVILIRSSITVSNHLDILSIYCTCLGISRSVFLSSLLL